jgi:site-specific recombinase XerD
MNTQRLPQTHLDGSAWSQAIYAFLAEKQQHSGSRRTVESYSRMLQDFFNRVGKTPDQVTSPEVLAYAHGIGKSGRLPSAITIGARIACVSSFYRFAIRMGALNANPCDALARPKVQPSAARGYTADDVRRLLAAIPDTVAGRRDRAIVLVLVMTARRRSEVINLRAADITVEGETAFYSHRGKGGKRGRRELPRPAYDAIARTLDDCEKTLATMHPDESLWKARASAASRVQRSTRVCGSTWWRQAFPRPASIYSATRPPSCAVRRENRSRLSANSWTTHLSP